MGAARNSTELGGIESSLRANGVDIQYRANEFAYGGGCVIGVVLAAHTLLAVGGDELWRHQFWCVAKRDELPRKMMGATARFHPDDARRQLRQDTEELVAPHLWTHANGLASGVDAVQREDVLGQVDAHD